MIATKPPARAKLKHKSFTYRTQIRWIGGKAGKLYAEDKIPFRIASPPEFRGESGVWTPEDMFVAAAESCVMNTFIALAERRNLVIMDYHSSARGHLEFQDGSYRFTKIVIRPIISVNGREHQALTEELIERAHQKCLIANSMRTEVIVEPVVNALEINVSEE